MAPLPANVAAVLMLSNTRCEECMAAYGLTLPLDADNVVAWKRRLLANYLGIRAGILEQISLCGGSRLKSPQTCLQIMKLSSSDKHVHKYVSTVP